MSSSEENKKDEVVCEFFGLKISTKNPNLARVLKTEVSEFMSLDVHDVRDYIVNQDQENIDDLHYNSLDTGDTKTDMNIKTEIDDVINNGDGRSSPDGVEGDDNSNISVDVDQLVDEWLDKY